MLQLPFHISAGGQRTQRKSLAPPPARSQTYFKVKGQLGQRKQGFHTQTFVERSRFLRKDGRWLYVDGDQNWNKEGADGEEAAAAES